MRHRCGVVRWSTGLVLAGLLLGPSGAATALTTVESQPYLLIGNAINDAVLISNFEIGANQAPVLEDILRNRKAHNGLLNLGCGKLFRR